MTPWQDNMPHSLLDRDESIRPVLSSSTEHFRPAPVRRSPDGTTDSGSSASCTPGSKSRYCQYDESSTTDMTLPIALGVAIPLFLAFVLCFYLHRRYKLRQRLEDENDKHKSLDFGLGEITVEKPKPDRFSRKKSPRIQETHFEPDKTGRSRGISFDIGNPYVLPPMLHDSRGSLHSLSRSQDDEGPYHSVHLVRTPELSSPRPQTSRSRYSTTRDSSSVNTSSTDGSIVKSDLLVPSQKPATVAYSASSTPSRGSTPQSSPLPKPEAAHVMPRAPIVQAIVEKPAPVPASPRLIREGTDQSGAFVVPPRNESRPTPIPVANVVSQTERSAPVSSGATNTPRPLPSLHPTAAALPPPPPRHESRPVPPPVSIPQPAARPAAALRSPVTPLHQSPPPRQSPLSEGRLSGSRSPRGSSSPPYDDNLTYADVLGIVQKQSTTLPTIGENMGATGLGLNGVTYDNPEQRANKVGSFYREYFGNSNGYDYDYSLEGATIFDPETGQFVVAGAPWNNPITRRAMTPPPRAPPRFRDSPSMGGRRSLSATRNGNRGRAYSSASANAAMGGARGRQFRRPMPMPGPLSNLPTPHLLAADSALMSSINFAPPITYKDRQAGRTKSPLMVPQPYITPRAHGFTPLASSFNDLPVMPSPHALRKSASFTALDFAPPQRFRRAEGGSSDNGSTHSGGSGMSAAQLASIRAGAYRVSRIPKEVVGTRNEFAESLRPQWNMRS